MMSVSIEDFAREIESGALDTLESWIADGSIDVNARLPRANEPPALTLAAELGHHATVAMLLTAGARIDAADGAGRTACHAAAVCDRVDALAALLACGPNLGLRDAFGLTPFDHAVDLSHVRIVALLIRAGAPLEHGDRVCLAASKSTAVIQALVNRNVVVRELCDVSDCTPCHYATEPAVVDMLLRVCAVDVNARDWTGDTCAHHAALYGKHELLRRYIIGGADIEIRNNEGFTPLQLACACVDDGIDGALLLLAAGADVHARCTDTAVIDGTAGHLAARRGDVATLHALLAAGADLDTPNARGDTAQQMIADSSLVVDNDAVESARRRIATVRLELVRHRATQVCIGLRALDLDALVMCEILQHSFPLLAPLVPFHIWWKFATTTKHFAK